MVGPSFPLDTPEDPFDEPGCSSWTDPEIHSAEVIIPEQIKESSQGHARSTQTAATQKSWSTRIKKTQVSPHTREMGCQVDSRPSTISVGTEYDPPEEEEAEDMDEEGNISDVSSPKHPSSPEYRPQSSSSDDHSSPEKLKRRKRKRGQSPRNTWEQTHAEPHEEAKYIVFESKLFDLFKVCPSCGSGNVELDKRVVGTLIAISRECLTCDERSETWESQPYFGNTPAGNILLSGAVLFAGGSCATTLRILDHLGVASISERTFYRHQESVLEPAVNTIWEAHQRELIGQLQATGNPLVIGGDGRADSPGHSAKYGLYTAIELNQNKILDLELVQSNEVQGSYHMELEGFKRVMQYVTDQGLEVSKLVTDRHRQLAKYVREKHSGVNHMFDVWHVAKGIQKKVHALAKQKDCEVLFKWERSITNHLYWVAASSRDDEEELKVAKWKSLGNHIQGIHDGHSEIFPKCLHGDLEGQGVRKKWLKPGTKACEKLDDIIGRTLLVNDVKKLSGGKQTSSLESFHGLINNFAPKLKAYGYRGMTTRLQLAALHYNGNSDRQQATTKKGEKCYKVSKPKYTPGRATIKKRKEAASFSYVDDLMAEVARRSTEQNIPRPEKTAIPPPLSSQYSYPTKEELIQQHQSRFSLDA